MEPDHTSSTFTKGNVEEPSEVPQNLALMVSKGINPIED